MNKLVKNTELDGLKLKAKLYSENFADLTSDNMVKMLRAALDDVDVIPVPEPEPVVKKILHFDSPDVTIPKYIFPSNWTCYKDIADLPVASSSAERIRFSQYHPNFRMSFVNSMPFNVVSGVDKVPLTIGPSPLGQPDESYSVDFQQYEKYKGSWPIGDWIQIENARAYFDNLDGVWVWKGVPDITSQRHIDSLVGKNSYDTDRHASVYSVDEKALYEFYKLFKYEDSWYAGYAVKWDCTKLPELQREPFDASKNWWGHTSADAAGLPILPLMLMAHELDGLNEIEHALRCTVPRHILEETPPLLPAVHRVHTWHNNKAIRMGERLRMKKNVIEKLHSSVPERVLKVIRCMQKYGLIVTDIGGTNLGISCCPNTRWYDINTWTWELNLNDFEIVKV